MALMFGLLETSIKLISFGNDFSLKLLKVRILLTEKKIQQKEREKKSFFRYEIIYALNMLLKKKLIITY